MHLHAQDEVALGDSIHNVHTRGYLSEHRMASVQVRLWGVRDEELASVGVRARVGHRNHATVVLEGVLVELILELVARSATARARGVSALDHKVFDHAVKGDFVVEPIIREEDEVVHRVWRVLGVKFEFNYALRGFHRDAVRLSGIDADGRCGAVFLDWIGH